MFDKDPETGALGAVHHPFTAPMPEDIPLLETAPERARAQAYDLVFNGTELGGGSIRISDPRLQQRVFALLGIDEATAQARFGFLLEGLRAGAPPHGGIAFGFDRISMQLAGRGLAARRHRVSENDGGARAVRGRAVAGAGRGPARAAHQRERGHGVSDDDSSRKNSRPRAPTRSRSPA